MTDQPSKGRSYEKHQEIAAPIESVWAAVTDDTELTRWFCEVARCGEGVGAEQYVDWGGGMAGTAKIVVWEPPHHLRTEPMGYDPSGGTAPSPEPYATDWYLTHEGGVTKLRMVQSGFGEGPAWDAEYDGTFHGWDMFLSNMRHYLNHHRGKPVASMVFPLVLTDDLDVAWAKLMGPAGLLKEGSLEGIEKGKHFRFVTSRGDLLEGTVTSYNPGHNFAAIVESLDQALLNIELVGMGEMKYCWITLKTWGLPEEQTTALREALDSILQELFPQPVAGNPGGGVEEPAATA